MVKPLIFVHRGCENWDGDRARFRGVDFVELDIRKTADDVLVVSHARSVKNLPLRVLIDQHPYRQLTRKTGRLIPRLDEVVEELRGRVRFNLDLRQRGMVAQLRRFLKRHRLEREVLIDSRCHHELAELYQEFPNAMYAYEFNYRDYYGLSSHRVFRGIAYLSYFALYPFWPQLVKLVTRRTPFVPGATIYYRLASRGLVDFFHSRGIPVYVWSVNRVAAMRQMIELGVEGIKTHKPELLQQVLSSQQRSR